MADKNGEDKIKQQNKELQKAKAEEQRFAKLASELVKNRVQDEKNASVLKDQFSEKAKEQIEALRNLGKPSSLMKAVGLASGSPFVAIMGAKLGELTDAAAEAKENNKSENQKLVDLLKANGKSSDEIAMILETTKRLSADQSHELEGALLGAGIRDKEVLDKFVEIRKEGDEKLLKSNYDIVHWLKETGVDEKEHAAEIRRLMDENLKLAQERDEKGKLKKRNPKEQAFIEALAKQQADTGLYLVAGIHQAAMEMVDELKPEDDQLQEQKEDQKLSIAERQASAQEQLVKYTSGIYDNLKEIAEEFAKKSMFGLGVIAAALAAPVFALVGFFESLSVQIKFLNDLTGDKLGKIFKPIKNFFTSLKELKIFKWLGAGFDKVISSFKSVFAPVFKFFKSLNSAAAMASSFAGPFKAITSFAQSFGRIIGKLFLPFQILSSAWYAISGFIDGFKSEDDLGLGLIAGIREGIVGLVDGLIGGLLKMFADGTAWILNFLGFTSLATSVKEGVYGFVDGMYDFIRAPFEMIKAILTGDSNMFFNAVKKAWDFSLDVMLAPVDMFIGALRSMLSIVDIDLPEFSIAEFLKQKVSDAIDAVKGFFGFGTEDEEIDLKDATKNDLKGKPSLSTPTAQANLAQEQEELALYSNNKGVSNAQQASEMAKEEKVAQVNNSTQNNNLINTNNNNIIQPADMSVGTDDASFHGAVFGA